MSSPLPAMLTAVRSLHERHLKALTTGEGRGLSQEAMAQHLEEESGLRMLYDALQEMLDAHEPYQPGSLRGDTAPGDPTPGTELFTGRQIRAACVARYALTKARGEQ